MNTVPFNKYLFSLILFLCGSGHAELYTPYQTSIYIVENPTNLADKGPDLDRIGVSQEDLAKSFQQGQELSNKINMQRQKRSLEKILAKNTLANGDVDLIAALNDARSTSSENVNAIAQMIKEDNYKKQQTEMQNKKLEAEKKLNEAKSNYNNANNERLHITSHYPPQINSISNNAVEEKVYIEHIDDNLYKTDDGRIIKTESCYEYIYGEKAIIMKNKIIFRNGKLCSIEKVIDL